MSDGTWRLSDPSGDGVAVGVPVLDAEHAIQFQLLNAVAEAVGRREDRRALELFDQFIDYTGVHFLSEQILMRLHSYPGYSDHLHAHDRLLREVRALRDGIVSAQAAVDQRLVDSLRVWLEAHIKQMDGPLGAYLVRGASGPR